MLTRRIIRHLSLFYLAFVSILFSSCQSYNHSEKKASYGEATKELMEMVEKKPNLKSMLIASIEKASKINPDTATNPAQSLDEFYAYASKAETSVPWALAKDKEHPLPSNNIFMAFCALYFPIDQPLPQLEGKGYFNNSLQYAEPLASWLTKFNKSWGKYLDSEESWNESYYQMALQDSSFGLQKGWYEDPSHWKTFNQFFSRKLRSPAARPIASPDNNSVVTSFADAVPQGVWAIDRNSNIVDKEGLAIKSATIKSITKLLGDDSQYKDSFANGTFTHSFLNVNDYHRYHFPVTGTIKEVRIIQGINPSGGTLTWDKDQRRYKFNPSATGWQMLETRGCVVLETDEYGLVALLPVGMAAVGSVNFMDNIKVGTKVKKGDMLGYFLFGGSDFIMLFQHKVQFTLDAPKAADNNTYKHLLMGERLGHLVHK
ncbi:phosphatidylserine decarboxylase [Pontibacter ruber]|uniref:Phosphatidylserine decarboxylase n=1 Tax=Pontibacter ruber TaxID=1343895 RepID=A0ABW5D2L9_9BACT|nr:phosphatidylserine decarboxylase [Pontibacter ruber]